MKKYNRSYVAIACYVIAALVFVYFIYVAVSTIQWLYNYYADYNMAPLFREKVTYILQNGLTALSSSILIFMAGFILDTVRRQHPANWMTDDERAEAKEARAMAKDAKKIAKGEAAAAKLAARETPVKETAAAEKSESPDFSEEPAVAEPVTFSAVVAESEEEPAEEPAEESSEESAEEPAEELAEESSEESAEEPAEESAEEPAEEPAEEAENFEDQLREAIDNAGL